MAYKSFQLQVVKRSARTGLIACCFVLGILNLTGVGLFAQIDQDRETEEPGLSQELRELFLNRVQPILAERCFHCHGKGEIEGGLVLTHREGLLKGGDSGAAIDLAEPLESLLLEAINYESYEMPPDGKLAEEDIEALTRWVEAGAPWVGEGFIPEAEHAHHGPPQVTEETKKFWSFQPVARSAVPQVESEWPANEIDAFIWDKLQEQGMVPNPPASKHQLIRRLYYDLTGLPPTIEEVDAFFNDESPDAYEELVDRLLASKHYGEKWGRHWLDLVRYAESNSYERDDTKPFVWRYRDYVIQSLNDDKPYDEFVREQLAGDEYEDVTPERIIATGYYRLGIWDDEPVDHEQAWYDDMDDVLATTAQTMLGLTLDCARCHDHKIDPVPLKDYYRFLAFFRNIRRYGVRAHETVLDASTRSIAPKELQEKYAADVREHERRVRRNRRALEQIEAIVKPTFESVEHEEFNYEMNRVPLVEKRVETGVITREQADQYKLLFDEMRGLRRNRPKALEAALCVKERGSSPPETYVLFRGNLHVRGDQVEPGFPSVLSPPEPAIVPPKSGESSGRRMALANWITSESNPLTARVMINRSWQNLFGRGIVRTSSDFGFQGERPTHPELLDWLADEFVQGGWKLKRMHKMMLMSSTYRMSSAANEAYLVTDPLNNLFWRYNMRRLTAEEVRDSILAVNQSLNREKMFGPSIYPKIPAEVLHGQSRPGENWGTSSPEDITRRTIYVHIKRSLPVPLLASFDIADPDTPCPARFNTVQPTQALGMLNSDFVNEEAEKLAADVANLSDELSQQVGIVLTRVTQRHPAQDEIDRGVEFVEHLREKGVEARAAFKYFCLLAYNLNEFIFLD
ncbi:MAG TPA: DUF1553 domain-containing protein [Pirellulaceae bacterium]|nr:DUF1553 domain-containing protein [Pirellulaceae bacterium]HMP70210.1 DUF1553 domain-containing protein [Pirellulaceae bacterium]